MTTVTNYDAKYRTAEGKAIDDWKMSPQWLAVYEKDPKVMHLQLRFEAGNWFRRESLAN